MVAEIFQMGETMYQRNPLPILRSQPRRYDTPAEAWRCAKPRKRTRFLLLAGSRAFHEGRYEALQLAIYADGAFANLPEDLRREAEKSFDPILGQFRDDAFFQICQAYPPEKTTEEKWQEAARTWRRLDFEIRVQRLREIKHRHPHLSNPGYVLDGDLRRIARTEFLSFADHLKNLLLPTF